MALTDGFFSLFRDINKFHVENKDETQEGVVSELLPELELSMDDEELISLKKTWEKKWEPYEEDIRKFQDLNESYWLGKQNTPGESRISNTPVNDNLIWEALETYLPIATKNPPEPMVLSDNTDEGNEIADTTQKMLVHQSERLSINLKIMRVARNWALALLGVQKMGWDMNQNDMTCFPVRAQKLILDPDSTIDDNCESTSSYIGEYRKDSADILVNRFKSKKDHITSLVNGKMATEIQYIEWWTDDYVFWTVNHEVLGKAKNPHWNYEQDFKSVDDFGNEAHGKSPGKNFFKTRKKPYVFLSVFNLGKRPHDDTSLIGQNIAKQDVVGKRQKQIDKNADWMNGGWAISGEKSGLTRDQASQAIDAARKGGGLWFPQGVPQEAIMRLTGTGLPGDVFNQLADLRNEIRSSFGTSGSTPEGTKNEETVRGKMMVRAQDGDRIGGGVSKYLEKFAEQTFKWFVQLMYVYYTEPHSASIVGEAKSKEYFTLMNQDFGPELTVSVKTGSMIPKDSLTKANQAIDLAGQGLLDPLTLFTRLDDANPKEIAGRTMLFKADPMAYMQKYFPDMVPPQQPQQQKPPSVSISYKDLPPEGKSQAASQAGIQVSPEDIAIEEAASEVIKHGARASVFPAATAQVEAAGPNKEPIKLPQ